MSYIESSLRTLMTEFYCCLLYPVRSTAAVLETIVILALDVYAGDLHILKLSLPCWLSVWSFFKRPSASTPNSVCLWFVKILLLVPSLLGVKIHTGPRRNGILDLRSLYSSVLIGIVHSIIIALRYSGAKCLAICCWDFDKLRNNV